MNSLREAFDIELPVIQAPMAGVQDEVLAVAVAEAGGLGSLPCALLDGAQLSATLARVAARTMRQVNLNFFCHAMPEPDVARELAWREALAPYFEEFGISPPAPTMQGMRRPIDAATVDLLEAHRPRIVSFHFGLPAPPLLARIKAWGATVLASATTLDEGRWLQAHGADVVIAQGMEAGGHRGHFLSEDLALRPSTLELVSSLARILRVPIVAAGGIASASDARAMLDAGAMAVQVGTAYLRCPEATTSRVHRDALASEGARTTQLTSLLSGRPARGIVNRLMRDLGPMSTLPPAFPWAAQALAPLRSRAEALGRGDFSPLWCGTNVAGMTEAPAADVTRRIAGLA